MNRTIKFRGKRVDNGEWYYGNYIDGTDGRSYIMDFASVDRDAFTFQEVLPETVGQFTGLHDRNGKEIYEGDVVKFTMGDEERICVVEYKNGGFMVESDGFFGLDEFDVTTIGFAFDEMDETIVVGNIHDNPELLEDKA